MTSFTIITALASSPFKGSSIKITSGLCNNPEIICTFCFIPFEKFTILSSLFSLISNNESNSSAFRATSFRSNPYMVPINSKYSIGVKCSYITAFSGIYPILFFTSISFSRTSYPNTSTFPSKSSSNPHIIFTVVDFPAPLLPR